MMPIQRGVQRRYMQRLVRSPRGRAFFLNALADAEVEDEGRFFDALTVRISDPALRKTVEKHHADEKRHHGMLLDCVARTGSDPGPVPADLRYSHRLDLQLGGFVSAFDRGEAGVLEAYALLLVLEERFVKEMPAVIRSLEEVDPETARVMTSILRDEERHVKYATAICRRYAPDDETRERAIRRVRVAEERAFFEHNVVLLRHSVERELLAVGEIERGMWRAVAALANAWVARSAVTPAPFAIDPRVSLVR